MGRRPVTDRLILNDQGLRALLYGAGRETRQERLDSMLRRLETATLDAGAECKVELVVRVVTSPPGPEPIPGQTDLITALEELEP